MLVSSRQRTWRVRLFRLRNPSLGLGLLAALLSAVRAPAGSPVEKPENLISKSAFPAKWQYVSSEKGAKLAGTWTLDETDKKNPFLKCTGKPHGYLRTKSKYGEFTLNLEWRYASDPNCNSGVLIHSANGNTIWPASIQVQLHRPEAGSIFPLKGARTTNQVKVTGLNLPVKVWHKCRIVSREQSITVYINGKKVGEVNGCKPAEGYICLQSEGSEIHFRNLTIAPITKKKSPPEKKTPPRKPKSPPAKTAA